MGKEEGGGKKNEIHLLLFFIAPHWRCRERARLGQGQDRQIEKKGGERVHLAAQMAVEYSGLAAKGWKKLGRKKKRPGTGRAMDDVENVDIS